tara:strand:+ start:4917 stop:5855 length:939 start_codon:yes stop_codon:yes gene_type:complete
MKILVTGAAGFLGSKVFNNLAKEGYNVYGIDNLRRGKLSNLETKKNFFKIDLENHKKVKNFLKNKGPFETIIHLATIINEILEKEILQQDIKTNLFSTINLLEQGYKRGLKKFIYGSSIAVYGKIDKKEISENDSKNPITSYGISKLMTEKYIQYLVKNRLKKVQYIILRYSNLYGPKQSDLGEVGVIRNFIKDYFDKNIITKHGNGKQIRDFLYVDDAAEATIKSIFYKKNSIFNLTYGSSKSVNYIIDILKSILKKNIKLKKKKFHSGEYHYFRASSNLIKSKLKWHPKTNLKKGIETTIIEYLNEKYSK